MENIEVIRKAHGIDQDLRQLASSLQDGGLRERVLAMEASYRDLVYAISASVSGVDLDIPAEAGKKRSYTRRVRENPLDQQAGGATEKTEHTISSDPIAER